MENLFMAHIDHGIFRSVSREKALRILRAYDNLDHSARIDELATSTRAYTEQRPDREYVYGRGNYEFRRFDRKNIPAMFDVEI